MQELEILARIFLAIGFGAILGLETETRATEQAKLQTADSDAFAGEKFKLGGVRTYILLSLFGALGGLLFYFGQVVFGYLIFGAVMGLILSAYILNVYFRKAFGMTAEIAVMIVTIVGFMATSGLVPLQILIVIVVVLTFVLSQKQGIALLVSKIAHEELIDVVKFTIVALVILPFLPNSEIYVRDLDFIRQMINLQQFPSVIGDISLLNPFRLWQYVVLISGFSLLGYFASRAVGKARGLFITGILGGLISSTSVLISMAERSKHEKDPAMQNSLAGAALASHAVSFIPAGIIALSTSVVFFQETMMVAVAMSAIPLVIGVLLVLYSNKFTTTANLDSIQHKPFSLNLAIKFALLLTIVKLIVQVANIYLPEGAFVLVTALSGISGIDVATIAIGELVGRSTIPASLGAITFVMVNTVNFAAKSVYVSMEGSKRYAQLVSLGILASLIAVGLVLFIQNF